MPEKRIVIDIDNQGKIEAETFEMQGAECLEELDKLLKDLALESQVTKKDEFYKNSIATEKTIKIKH